MELPGATGTVPSSCGEGTVAGGAFATQLGFASHLIVTGTHFRYSSTHPSHVALATPMLTLFLGENLHAQQLGGASDPKSHAQAGQWERSSRWSHSRTQPLLNTFDSDCKIEHEIIIERR